MGFRPSRKVLSILLLTAVWASAADAFASQIRLVSAPAPGPEQKSIEMFRTEFTARYSTHLVETKSIWPLDPGDVVVFLGLKATLATLMPSAMRPGWKRTMRDLRPNVKAEGFAFVPSRWKGHPVVILCGNDQRGELFALGWLLRNLRTREHAAVLPSSPAFFSAPEKPVRGYQIGYRMKNNTYDAWTLPQFEQQMRDLAVFGMNTVQLIAPVSDDAAVSPLYPAPALQTLIGISRLSQEYGLRFDLYYPELKKDYGDRSQVQAELTAFEDLVRALPLIDSVHIPGGDPGRTPPDLLLPLVQKETAILHRYHPDATVWISAQGFDRNQYEVFYRLLAAKPEWLTGVFFGPQSRDGLQTQRRHIPSSIKLEFYPDIGHTMHAQFPVPRWDPIFALTEGREPICPRPAEFTHIYQSFSSFHSGFMLYSEGVNDDVNKFLWAELGWDGTAPPRRTLTEYARYLLHAPDEATAVRAAESIEGLEANWNGPLLSNRGIPAELKNVQELRKVLPGGWRWESLQYRAAYDQYAQLKRGREDAAQMVALQALRSNGTSGDRAQRALAALNGSSPGPTELDLHDRLFALAGSLFHEVGLQLSVKLYGASNWERGANLDRVDTPLNEKVWLTTEINSTLASETEVERIAKLQAIAAWQKPSVGALYDDLGDASAEPHLVRGKDWSIDPELYETAIDGIADQTLEKPWRLSWLSYAETLYETPLSLRYANLAPGSTYRLRVTYAGEDYHLPMRLVANATRELQSFRARRSNPETLTYDIPAALTADGKLSLEWTRPPGAGGSGRGGQVAEVWLIPSEQDTRKETR